MKTVDRLTMAAVACGFLGSLGIAVAADPSASPAPATMARPAKTLAILTPAAIDPAHVLPPPPSEPERVAAELAEVQRAYRTRTPERYAQAQWDDKHEDAGIFDATLGADFDRAALPETAKFLALVVNEQSVAATMAKRYFQRVRPWALDASIVPCDYKPNATPNTSYPSGHATLGYTLGYVLASLMPEKAPAILTRAAEYAYSREICGDHFPSDLEASHALGTAVAIDILNSPLVAVQIQAVRDELRAARMTASR